LKIDQIEYVAEELHRAIAAECDAAEMQVATQGRFSEPDSNLRERV
jgi:hypothetical protein